MVLPSLRRRSSVADGLLAVQQWRRLSELPRDPTGISQRSPLRLIEVEMPRKAGVLIGVLITGIFGVAIATDRQPAPTPSSPFSAVLTWRSTIVFSDGNQISRSNTSRYFRDGLGRTRKESNGYLIGESAPPRLFIEINDPVSGERITLQPWLKRAFALKVPDRCASVSLDNDAATTPSPLNESERSSVFETDRPPVFGLIGIGIPIATTPAIRASVETRSLGEKSISGMLARGTLWVRTIPAGLPDDEKSITTTREEWISPDLGITVEVHEQSTIGGQIDINLTELSRDEPDPSLFTVPGGYTVNRPGGRCIFLSSQQP
jgi:hypothetical protein